MELETKNSVIPTSEQGKVKRYQLEERPITVQHDRTHDLENVSDSIEKKTTKNVTVRGHWKQDENYSWKVGRRIFICRPNRNRIYTYQRKNRRFKMFEAALIMISISASNAQYADEYNGNSSNNEKQEKNNILRNTLHNNKTIRRPVPTIMTSPIVFGESVTFKCEYVVSKPSSTLSTRWLKGQEKEVIAYGNSSTNETKYTSSLQHEGNQYTYLFTVHDVSFTDLSIYSCEFDFQGAFLTFSMTKNLSIIYVPNKTDIIFNITHNEPLQLKVLILNIYPQPSCTIFFKEKDITSTITTNVDFGMPLYSIEMEMSLNDCSGNWNISCIVGSRNFTRSEDIQQCCKGNESQSNNVQYMIFAVIALVIISAIVTLCVVRSRCQRRRRRGDSQNETRYSNILICSSLSVITI